MSESQAPELDPTVPTPEESTGPTDASQSATAESVTDTTTEKDMVAELQETIRQYHDQVLRLSAEMENLRKRTQEEIAKARKFSTESFAASLLPVKDSLEAALAQEEQNVEGLLAGVETTLKQLSQAFERNHLKEIMPQVGDKFDPHLHQAISSMPHEELEKDCITQSLQKGYTIAERVVRPALVMVSSGKQS